MLYVGLTGGIGSGKSTATAKLAELGAVIIDADELAREVVAPGSDGLAEIATRFGEQVLLADGSLNRQALGEIVFADERDRRDLEAITHPRIRALTAARHTQAPPEAIVVHDMPLLVEGDLAPEYQLTLVVDATRETRIERIVRDRGMTHEAARARISAQATDEQRYAVADVLLDNNGTREQLLEQVETLWRERLSPYNDNLLAERPAPHASGEDERAVGERALRRAAARLERRLTRAGLDDRVAVTNTAAASSAGAQLVVVTTTNLLARPAFRSALRAAGFVAVPAAYAGTHTARHATFGSCDPAAPFRLQVGVIK